MYPWKGYRSESSVQKWEKYLKRMQNFGDKARAWFLLPPLPARGCRCKNIQTHPYGCNICKKGTFKKLFLTKSEFQFWFWGKNVKDPPLWVQKSAKPCPYRNFFKTRPFRGHIHRLLKYAPNPGIKLSHREGEHSLAKLLSICACNAKATVTKIKITPKTKFAPWKSGTFKRPKNLKPPVWQAPKTVKIVDVQ